MSHSLRQSSPTILLFARIIRTGTLDLPVNDVGQSISKIGSIVIRVGGFVEKSTQTNSGGHSATMTVRVPPARLDQVMSELKGPATNVDRESTEVHCRMAVLRYHFVAGRGPNSEALMGKVWALVELASAFWRLPWRRATSRTEPGTQ
jgi:hypothetical protein